MKDPRYSVGQTVYYGGKTPVTITKVGHKWLTLSNAYRADRETLIVKKDYGSHVKVYLSEQAYALEVERDQLWTAFRRATERRWQGTAEQVRAAAVILGLTIE